MAHSGRQPTPDEQAISQRQVQTFGAERRKYRRVDDDLGIAVNVVSESGEMAPHREIAFHMTRDISRYGLRFQHDHALPLNTRLKIHVAVKLPTNTITHVGRVRWVREERGFQPYSIGVEFTDTPEADMAIWQHYVDHRVQLDAN